MKITNQFKSRLRTYFIKRLGAFDYKHGWSTSLSGGDPRKESMILPAYSSNSGLWDSYFISLTLPSQAVIVFDSAISISIMPKL